VGGHLRPGDRVDVLVQYRSQAETGDRTSAMLALSDLRVLAYENQLPEEPEVVEAKEGDKEAKSKDEKAEGRRANNPSVVLAVPADQATRLLLAVGTGEVRLALRPPVAEVPVLAGTTPYETASPANAREAKKITLSQLTFSKPPAPVTAAAVLPPGVAPGAAPKVRTTTQVEIFEGEKSRSVSLTKP
jgi:pilus assembly protein CpaB